MARNFRRHRSSHPIAELNVTNLIDLGFMLLIIFMIVASPTIQDQQKLPIKLPTTTVVPQTPDPTDVTESIGVDAKGNYFLDTHPISFADLQTRLKGFAAQKKQPVIRVLGDENSPYKNIARVMAELQKLGLTRLVLPTEAEKE